MSRSKNMLIWVLLVLFAFPALAQEEPDPLAEVRHLQGQARKLGAKSHLPMAWRRLDTRLDRLEEQGATPEMLAQVRLEAELLRNQADYLREIRERKNSHEELLDRFDQALLEIATLFAVPLDPVRTGSDQSRILLDRLAGMKLRRQVTIDSLTLDNRRLQEIVSGSVAGQDSIIQALTAEVSDLRQELWETQLRAGVAEADRSAAETVLTRKQQREEAMGALFSTLDENEGEILIKGHSHVTMRLTGVTFASGSSSIGAAQARLLSKVAEALQRFPGAEIRIEGHTDNSGGRQANLRLSRRRAEAVARNLEKMLGRQEGSIATAGLGPDRPLALNDTPEGRARNRRIDLHMTLPE